MHEDLSAPTVPIPHGNPIAPVLPVGFVLRDYKILQTIGRGGFGITYLAEEEITERRVVIKENYPAEVSFRDMISYEVTPSGRDRKESYDWALTRFLDEAKVLARLNHPNIVPIRNAFKALGTAYYVMPHVEGTELHKAAPAPDTITAKWLQPVLVKLLSALDYLHAQGLIHRDIKPTNILVTKSGEPILIDFGTARAQESTHTHTKIGTPGFMPFEQFSAKGKRGPWTDLYALGATCYHLITGQVPPDAIERMMDDEYLPLAGMAELSSRFPLSLLSSIDKALNMPARERWQNAQEWLDALETAELPIITQTKPELPPPPQKQIQVPLARKSLTEKEARDKLQRLGIKSNKYNTALLSAAEKGELQKIQLLITAGADVNKVNQYGNSPLSLAAFEGHTECVKLLLAASDINLTAYTPLDFAVMTNDSAELHKLITSHKWDINQANQDGFSPLSWAASAGHVECMKILLTAPEIDVNKVVIYGCSPLFVAAFKGRTECVKLLLAAPGIDVNLANQNGDSPLIMAAFRGHTECVKLLLAAPGIDVNKKSKNGYTALRLAKENGHRECAELIRRAGGKKGFLWF